MSNRWTPSSHEEPQQEPPHHSVYDAYEETQRLGLCPYCMGQGTPSADPRDEADPDYLVFVCPAQHRFYVDRHYITNEQKEMNP